MKAISQNPLFDWFEKFDIPDDRHVFTRLKKLNNHFIHFHDENEQLLNLLNHFTNANFESNEAAMIISTKENNLSIDCTLRGKVTDYESIKSSGNIIFLDSKEVKENLFVDGEICRDRFDEIISPLISHFTSKFNKTYIYGDIVNVLAESGDYKSAVILEGWWHEQLCKKDKNEVVLLCGYNLKHFKNSSDFHQICDLHDVWESDQVYGKVASLEISRLKQKAFALEDEIQKRKMSEDALQKCLTIISGRAGDALNSERDKFRSLLSILPVGICDCERFNGFGSPLEEIFVNQKFCEISGLSKNEICENGWLSAIHPEDKEMVKNYFDSLPSSSSKKRIEYRFLLSNGSVRWVSAESVVKATTLGFVHTLSDITDMKRIEKERMEAQRKSEEIQRHRAMEAEKHKQQQDYFIDSLCHELRNPLFSILGNVELLQLGLETRRSILNGIKVSSGDRSLVDQQILKDIESVDAIAKSVAHQKVIMDDVLNLSKLEVGKVVLNSVEFDPKETLRTVTKMFGAQAQRKNLTLTTSLPPTNLKIKGDPDRLSQVLINLLSNAIKFTDQGSVTLSLNTVEKRAEYTLFLIGIEDTGIGLTSSEQAVLFNRFSQPPKASAEYEGSGLGLFISKALVELFGGQINVESEKGKGTKVSFTFKATEVIEEPPKLDLITSSNDQQATPPKPELHILVVEDNTFIQKIFNRMLTNLGCTSTIVSNGIEAISALEKENFDIIFMDIVMEGMDGLTATKNIRLKEKQKGEKQIPIIGISGNARDDHVNKAIEIGMNEYLTKPVTTSQIQEIIKNYARN